MQCYCGKAFYQINAFSNHQRQCKSSQQRLTTALTKAQQIWEKKRQVQRLKRLAADGFGGGADAAMRNEEVVAPLLEGPTVYVPEAEGGLVLPGPVPMVCQFQALILLIITRY